MANRQAVALTALLALAAVASAQVTHHELLNKLPPAAPGLSTAVYFPEHPTKQFPAGDVITAVVSAHNDASKAFNLTAVVASLNSPLDFSMHIQNFTHMVYFQELPPNQEASLEYKFRLAPQVPTRDFSVAIHLLYEDAGGGGFYSSVAFNGTVEVVEAPRLVDTDAIFMVLTILALFVGVGYWVYASAGDKLAPYIGKRGAFKRKAAAAGSGAAFDEDEWVKGTAYDASKKKAAAAAAAGTKKAA